MGRNVNTFLKQLKNQSFEEIYLSEKMYKLIINVYSHDTKAVSPLYEYIILFFKNYKKEYLENLNDVCKNPEYEYRKFKKLKKEKELKKYLEKSKSSYKK